MQLWDTAGQERFKSLIPSYIQDSSFAIICYDITSRDTFDAVRGWVQEAREARGSKVFIMVVGNKIDQPDQREVSTEEGQKLSQELGVEFIETSAKAGINVKALFKNLVANLPNQDTESTTLDKNIKLHENEEKRMIEGEADKKKKSGC